MRRAQGWLRPMIAWLLPLLLGACATLPRDASMPINDPNEDMNRYIMSANQELLRPASEFVKAAIPGPVHDRLHDLNSNLKEPRIFVNDVLQARFEAAAETSARFVVNSVFGVGGLFDVATPQGLQQQSGDFGQTLFVWGVVEGPYVVRPYLGPSTLRDAIGSTVDMFDNPMGWMLGSQLPVTIGSAGVDAADRLGQLKMAEDASIDFYSFIRSSYYQTRRAELREALRLPPVVDSPALDDPEAPAAPPASAAPAAPAPPATPAVPASKPDVGPSVPVSSRSAPRGHGSISPALTTGSTHRAE
jgi:phospholipid-binding lipoprotein MlaA